MIYSVSLFLSAFFLVLITNSTVRATKTVSSANSIGNANLVSFKPLEGDVVIGLDFEMPFIMVPLTNYKDKNGYAPATVNINTASLVTTGLMAGGSLILAHAIRTFSPFKERSVENDEEMSQAERTSKENNNKILNQDPIEIQTLEKRIGHREDFSYDVKNIIEHFKLVYKNGTSRRVETTLPNLFAVIEDTFFDNQIDIGSCVQKSICLMLYESSKSVRQGKATSIQKIIDGVSNFQWLLHALERYKELKRVIKASKMESNANCAMAYPTCKWVAPEKELMELLRKHIHFT